MPGAEFEGKVDSIARLPLASSNGLVKYEVKVAFSETPEGVKSGMSASSDVVLKEKAGVVLVPNKALRLGTGDQATVLVKNGEISEEKPVVVGDTDGVHTEILSGIEAGEFVILR
jgi:HlyD family secretion protein